MRIGYISDIHYDMEVNIDKNFIFENIYDVLVLGGDIGDYEQSLNFIEFCSNELPDVDIVFVPGNHEYHSHKISYEDINEKFRECDANKENVHVLIEGETWTKNDICFVGATLWSDLGRYSCPGDEFFVVFSAKKIISDFDYIDVSQMRDMYELHHSNIIKCLNNTSATKTIVVTHFPPTLECRNRFFKIDNIAYYFMSYAEDIIMNQTPNYWIFGHTHGDDETTEIHNTTFLCNQTSTRTKKCAVKTFDV